MPRRGRSTTVGKFAKLHQDRRVSEIRVLGELLRYGGPAGSVEHTHSSELREGAAAR